MAIKMSVADMKSISARAALELAWYTDISQKQFEEDFERRIKPITERLGLDYGRYKEMLLSGEDKNDIAEYIENDIELGYSTQFELNEPQE